MGKTGGMQPLLQCWGFFGLVEVLANEILLVALSIKRAGWVYPWVAWR